MRLLQYRSFVLRFTQSVESFFAIATQSQTFFRNRNIFAEAWRATAAQRRWPVPGRTARAGPGGAHAAVALGISVVLPSLARCHFPKSISAIAIGNARFALSHSTAIRVRVVCSSRHFAKDGCNTAQSASRTSSMCRSFPSCLARGAAPD